MTEEIKRLGLRINPALKRKLEDLADQDQRSLNQFIELLLEHGVKQIELSRMAGPGTHLFAAYQILPQEKIA
jgi:hypothetical protein